MARRLIAFAVMSLWLVLLVPAAQADTGNIIEKQNEPPTAADGWQAGTCTTDEPKCSPESPIAQFFRVAAGHPQIGFTQYTVKQDTDPGKEAPVGPVKTIRVDLPPGLTVNPEAVVDGEGKRCSMADFNTPVSPPFELPGCPPATQVGEEQVTLKVAAGPGKGTEVAPIPGVTKVPLYNLEPENGEPALFGFKAGAPGSKESVFLRTEVAYEGDYHESFTIAIPPPSPGTLTWKSRLVNFGRSGDGTYITNPTTCFSSEIPPHEKDYATFLRAESVAEPEADFPNSATPFEATTTLPSGLVQTGCVTIPFDPELEVSPGATQVDSPAGPTVNTKLKFIAGGTTQSESHLRDASVTLPQGMGLNPSGANGLRACTDEQFGKGTRNSIACPGASEIGTVEIDTPPLPAGALKGPMYLGQQLSRDPTSGDEFRFFVDAESNRYGIKVRLEGKTKADPKTGQLTTVFNENPQVPFTSVRLHFDGAKNVLTSPPTCAPTNATSRFEPWSTPASTKTPSSNDFAMTSIPGGGACPTTLAGRPFKPVYTAKSDSTKANAYSPFRVHIGRSDGQQELKAVNVTLPKGLAGNLTGIPYCSEGALAAAAASSGAAELASPSCSSASQIGTASTEAGTGSKPVTIAGKAYLTGPYNGAPLSLAVITPAVTGPFDLGNVVVRVALLVDPVTTQVHAVSDSIPDVYGGVKLDLRSIDVNVDRTKFMHNPTNCNAGAVAGFLNGGGSDPTNPAAFSSYPVSVPYQATACNKLGFKPTLHTRLFGGKGVTQRAKHPKLRAILETRQKDANVLRTALTLPHALFLDQGHIKTVCTRVQLAAQACPKAAIYGHAQARSPLLGKPLRGPVYLVSSNHTLPDLVADLRGQINVQLHGVISSIKGGGIKTVFNEVPDQPVSKFILRMEGGKKGLLVNSRNLCKGRLASVLKMKAQNGKKVTNKHLPLRVPCA